MLQYRTSAGCAADRTSPAAKETAAPEETGTEPEPTTADPADQLSKGNAESLAAYAAAVDKTQASVSKKGTKRVKVDIANPMEGDDGMQKFLKMNIAGVKAQKAVCDVLGEGDAAYEQDAKEGPQTSSLRASDMTKATAARDAKGNTVLTIHVKDCENPLKLAEGGSSLGRFTWDFANIATADAGVARVQKDVPGLKVNIAKKSFRYNNIKIAATVSPDGVLTDLVHSCQYTARVEGVEVKLLVAKLSSGDWG